MATSTQARLAESELILNADGSMYHLGLRPEHLALLVITVGDPERVAAVSAHFDEVTYRQQRREFRTHVGRFAGRPIMCISTGIGTDNVDIVLNELDALANVDFATRKVREDLHRLTFLRLGTSGTFQPDINVDTLLVSDQAIGLDGLGPFYSFEPTALQQAFAKTYPHFAGQAYGAHADGQLVRAWARRQTVVGQTLTCAGFYGPQRRSIRLGWRGPTLAELADFRWGDGDREWIANFEMETAGIYGLAKLLGHRAVSVSAILANRATGAFSERPSEIVAGLIDRAFDLIAAEPELWFGA